MNYIKLLTPAADKPGTLRIARYWFCNALEETEALRQAHFELRKVQLDHHSARIVSWFPTADKGVEHCAPTALWGLQS